MEDNHTYFVIIKNDLSFAVLGEVGNRKLDNKRGLHLVGQIDFKDSLDLSWDNAIDIVAPKALHVDGVSVIDREKIKGKGTKFYTALVSAGYTLISDTTQYIGGGKLWESLATKSAPLQVRVHIVEDGIVVN